MTFVHDYLRDSILSKAGVAASKCIPPLEELQKTEWNSEFEQLMRNRLIIGNFRYGSIHNSRSYDRVTSIRQRLDLFEVDGNGEHLVDISNLCLVLFNLKDHPKFHFKATDDGIHQKEK